MKRIGIYLIFLLLFGLAACQQPMAEAIPTATATRISGALTPYASRTPADPTQVPQAQATLAPAPTPTPQVHVVALGETMISIAFKYGITLEALQNANPNADPYALIVDDELVIPYQEPAAEGSTAPAPDPEPVTLSDAVCTPEASGGLWCLWTATNPPESGTENILVEIVLEAGDFSTTQVITAPLNISAADERVPMGAFFSAQALADSRAPYTTRLTLLQALPLNNTAARYVPVILQDGQIIIEQDRASATVSGNLQPAKDASSIWVVISAFDVEGQLVGFRRWTQETPLTAGALLPIEIQVFALGNGRIETVDVLLEGHP